MKRFRLLTLLALLMTAATGAWAQQTLTVYDGTFEEKTSPAYIAYIDEYTRSQTVIPSTALTAMKGCDITAMKFYSNSFAASGPIDYSFDVYLKEVSYTAFAESPTFEPKSSCTSVYQGTLSISNFELTITFSKPFHYNGGNLLLGMENTSKVMYYEISFLGTNTGSSLSNICIHDSKDLASASIKKSYFIPKTTFTYVVPTYTLTLDPAPVTKATVTIDDQTATPDENGKIADVKANSSVKLNANDGYIFKKVKVKKGGGEPEYYDQLSAGYNVTINVINSYVWSHNIFGQVGFTSASSGSIWNAMTITKEQAIALAEYKGSTSLVLYDKGEGSDDGYGGKRVLYKFAKSDGTTVDIERSVNIENNPSILEGYTVYYIPKNAN